jgi:hypothetical protein
VGGLADSFFQSADCFPSDFSCTIRPCFIPGQTIERRLVRFGTFHTVQCGWQGGEALTFWLSSLLPYSNLAKRPPCRFVVRLGPVSYRRKHGDQQTPSLTYLRRNTVLSLSSIRVKGKRHRVGLASHHSWRMRIDSGPLLVALVVFWNSQGKKQKSLARLGVSRHRYYLAVTRHFPFPSFQEWHCASDLFSGEHPDFFLPLLACRATP